MKIKNYYSFLIGVWTPHTKILWIRPRNGLVSTGNHMISNAIWDTSERGVFPMPTVGLAQFLVFEKFRSTDLSRTAGNTQPKNMTVFPFSCCFFFSFWCHGLLVRPFPFTVLPEQSGFSTKDFVRPF